MATNFAKLLEAARNAKPVAATVMVDNEPRNREGFVELLTPSYVTLRLDNGFRTTKLSDVVSVKVF